MLAILFRPPCSQWGTLPNAVRGLGLTCPGPAAGGWLVGCVLCAKPPVEKKDSSQDT